MKNVSRRTFAKKTSIAIGGVLSGIPNRLLAVAATSGGSQAESTAAVLEMLSDYSSKSALVGAGVAGSSSPLTRIVASVRDQDALLSFFDRAAGSPMYVSENEVSFDVGGRVYSVRNLTAEGFAEELQATRLGTGHFFNYQSLTADAGSIGQNSDPNFTITPLQHTSLNAANASNGFVSWFDALITSKSQGLEISDEAAKCGAVACAFASSSASAAQTFDAVVERVAYAAEVLDQETLRALFATRMVDASFRSVVGRSSSRISQLYPSLRRKFSGHTDSSIWLALAVGSIDDGGALHRALTSSNRLYAGSTRTALEGAMEILQSRSLTVLGVVGGGAEEPSATVTPPTEPVWQASDLAAAGDLDGDRVPSLVEYALGTDPLDPQSFPSPALSSELENGTRYLALTYQKNTALTDVTFVPQAANDLRPDHWSAEGVENQILSSSDGFEVHRARVPMTGSRQYLRLLVHEIE